MTVWVVRSEYFTGVATLTARNEDEGGAETGNHKGCPYDRFAGGYFQRILHVGCHRHH